MRALVIEHDPLSTPERVGDHLERRGVGIEPFVVVEDIGDPQVRIAFPEPESHDMVVMMGAPWSAYDHRLEGWVGPEIAYIRGQVARGTPILGICFGAQLLSASLGGTVSRSSQPEYGWLGIESSEPSIATGPWFQYHEDDFTLPGGALPLARSDSGLQAFRHQRNLALQFHPEVTAELVESWCAAGGDRKLIDAGLDPDRLIEETGLLARATQPALERMLDWWLSDFESDH